MRNAPWQNGLGENRPLVTRNFLERRRVEVCVRDIPLATVASSNVLWEMLIDNSERHVKFDFIRIIGSLIIVTST